MDARLGSERAKLAMVFARRGMSPDAAASWFLPRLVGIDRALDWMISGRTVDAAEALEAGYLRSVHPEGSLLDAARAYARALVEHSAPVSVALTRQLLWRMLGAEHPMAAHRLESRAILSRSTAADAEEGVAAFFEKRPAASRSASAAICPTASRGSRSPATDMRAAVWFGPGELRVVDREAPEAAPGQAVVEVAACGVCGSDLHSFAHGLAVKPGNVLGHEFSGRVVEAPGVEGLAVGDRVTVRPLLPCGECDRCRAGRLQLCEGRRDRDIGYGSPGAFAERVLVPDAIVGRTVFRLPDAVDDVAGALVEPVAVALHAVGVARAGSDDVVLVSGAGTIGLTVTALLAARRRRHARGRRAVRPAARRSRRARR